MKLVDIRHQGEEDAKAMKDTKSAMIKKALAWEQIQNNEQQVARKKLNQNDADLDKNEEGAEDGLKNKEGGSTNMG